MLVFVSDVHLTEPHTKKYEVFLSLLEEFRDSASMTEIFLCGDVFDLWLGHKSYFFSKHKKIIDLLIEIAKNKKVHIFEGNHDFAFKSSWWEKHSISIHKEKYEFTKFGKRFFVCHGDLLNKEDYSYRLLRWYLRSFIVKLQLLIFPGFLLNFIGNLFSSTESKSNKSYSLGMKEEFLKKWRHWIRAFKKNHEADVFICGHYHVRLSEKIDELETHNLGSWLGKTYKYFTYSEEGYEFKTLNP